MEGQDERHRSVSGTRTSLCIAGRRRIDLAVPCKLSGPGMMHWTDDV